MWVYSFQGNIPLIGLCLKSSWRFVLPYECVLSNKNLSYWALVALSAWRLVLPCKCVLSNKASIVLGFNCLKCMRVCFDMQIRSFERNIHLIRLCINDWRSIMIILWKLHVRWEWFPLIAQFLHKFSICYMSLRFITRSFIT